MTKAFACLYLSFVLICGGSALAQNLVHNPGFEQGGGGERAGGGGGRGEMRIDTAACNGARSLRLTKSNAVGMVVVQSSPIRLQPNVDYTCRVRFRAEDASLADLLLLRLTSAKDQAFGYNAIDRSAGWMSQSLLINSPAGQWEKRVGHYRVAQPQDVYVNLVLYGNPCSVLLDDCELLPNDYKVSPVRSEFRDACTPEELPGVLQARPEATARVVVQGGRSGLEVNGRPALPILYKAEPYTTEGDYRRFAEAGVNLSTVSVRLGSTASHRGVWLGKDRYDFAPAEAALQKALLRNPQAAVVLDVWFYPYPEWGAEHPTECWTNAEGRRGYGTWGNLEGFTDDLTKLPAAQAQRWWYPSYYSTQWRQEVSAAAAALIAHLRQTPYGRSIAGYFIAGGHDGQFQVFGSFDYSEAARQAFAAWLKQKYGTLERLREVWGAATPASFETVAVPAPVQQSGFESGTPYLSPGPALDYRDFSVAGAWQLRDQFSAAVKSAAGRPVVTIAYGNPPQYDFSAALTLSSLDAAASMSYYPYRNAGYALGYKPPSGFPLHGKLFFQEIDTRSWAGTMYGDEVYEMWIGAGLTPPQWQSINRKLSGISLVDQTGFWYYDMNHFFDAPEIMQEIGATVREAGRLRSRAPAAFRPDLCVVQGGGEGKYLGSDASSVNSSHFYQLMALEQSGVPYDLHYLQDVLARPELQQYKVYLFYQTRYLSTAQRQATRAKLQRGGKTLIFMHDDGYLSERGKSVEAQSELVGMRVATEETYARQTPLLIDGPLTRGCRPFIGLNEMQMTIMVQEGQSSFGARAQPFWIEDPAAAPLAQYAESGKTAAALRELPGWTAIYLADANSLTGDVLNSLARKAGAYVCGPAGQSVAMNGRFMSLHGLRSGDYALNMPAGMKTAREVETGKKLPVRGGRPTLTVEAQKTYWLEFE